MKIDDLKNSGAFLDAAPVLKPVTWTREDGEKFSFEVGIRRMSMGDWERVMVHDEDEKSASARILSTVVVLDEGVRFTYAQAYQLAPSLAQVLLDAHNEVNRRPAKKA